MNEVKFCWQNTFNLSRYGALIFFFLSLIMLIACNDNSSDDDFPFQLPDSGNYTQMSWVDAYDRIMKQMSEQYPFTEWKGINWVALNADIRPKMVQAMANDDEAAYATAILEYTKSIPDGHILPMGGMLLDLCEEQVAGSYGFGIIGLDDGRVIAHIVTEGGQAANAGMEAGDEILEWNGVPIADVLEQTSTLWRLEPKSLLTNQHSMLDTKSLATDEHTLLEKYRMLVLDPINTQSEVTFSKSEGSGSITAALTALNDNDVVLSQTSLWDKVDDTDLIQYEVLSSGYGYLLLGSLASEAVYVKLKEAMEFFTERTVPGMIIDLRGSRGGYDALAATFLGFFYSETTIYEYQSLYNTLTGKFEIVLNENDSFIRDMPLNIEPETPLYSGPIVVIVNPLCISSSEGVAMGLKNLPNCHVVGFYGSNGSFGISGLKVSLPGGYDIMFPFGRSLDKNKIIQIDSQNGIGGVTPDIRIPMTEERAIRVGKGEDVELEYAINVLEDM